MVKYLYSVYDAKARVYSSAFTSLRQEVAIRDFTRAARDPSSDINQFPRDYTLFELGEWDDETGCFQLHNTPVPLISANQILETEKS